MYLYVHRYLGFLLEKALACFYQVLQDKCPGFYNCLALWMQRSFNYLDENASVGLLRALNTWLDMPRVIQALFSILHTVKGHGWIFLLYQPH